MAGQAFYFDVVNGADVKIGVQGFAEFKGLVAVVCRFQTIFELVGDFDEKICPYVDVVFRIGQEEKPRFYFVFVDRNVFQVPAGDSGKAVAGKPAVQFFLREPRPADRNASPDSLNIVEFVKFAEPENVMFFVFRAV